MLSDPLNKDYILLETDLEAQAAFDAGLIGYECEYVYRDVPYPIPCYGYGLKSKRFIRCDRDYDKIKKIMEFLSETKN